ncbi:hypothetical protein N8I77_012347 [Diaporthe amygdali]|uniref:Uncharacterized protein n=1 Tax=Phomopsis amygdali TaxID=1214568 RepID=A0AAD9VYT6_PHOAM|nr:hypothetical protein N8I77_012347 [Diaporthe amygdali]
MATNTTKLNLKLSLPLPELFQHKKSRQERLPPHPEEDEQAHFEIQEVQEHEDSAEDASEWIKSTIREQGRWEEHLSFLRIDCPHTMAELLQLGRLSRSEGTKQCRKMIRIPVLYNEIGCFLWEKLAALERGPDFSKEDEERAAEYARVKSRAMLALDERFRFDQPASAATSGAVKKTGRARQDSEPISPKHIRHPQSNASHQARPSTSQVCQFCQFSNTKEHTDISDDIRAETSTGTSGQAQQPVAFFNHSRSSSYSSTVLWQRDRAAHSSPSATSSRSGSDASVHSRRSRDGSLAGRVGSVVGNLGKGVATAIGGGLSHGYGYGGRADRSGSFWSV